MNKEAVQYELKKFFDDEAAEFLSSLYHGNETLLIREPGKSVTRKKVITLQHIKKQKMAS